jgi:hypothetical protein
MVGLYRSVRDHQTVSIGLKGDHLEMDRRTLKPISANAFVVGENGPGLTFERDSSGKVARLRVAAEVDGGDYYERVDPAFPTQAELETMAGQYRSDEADQTFRVSVEQGHLVLYGRPDMTVPLSPTYRDGFSGSVGSVRFIRDHDGRVIELSIGQQRVWDMRFRRLQ